MMILMMIIAKAKVAKRSVKSGKSKGAKRAHRSKGIKKTSPVQGSASPQKAASPTRGHRARKSG